MVFIKCKICGHVWDYKGKSQYATCPMCHYKINVQKHKIDFNEEEIDQWLIEQLKKAEQKLPEYKPKIQWCIETLSSSAPATPTQKISARMFALSIIKNL